YDNFMDKAVAYGWTALVNRLIDVGFDLQSEPAKSDGSTLLHWASAQGRERVAKHFIEAGADVNATALRGRKASPFGLRFQAGGCAGWPRCRHGGAIR